MKKQHFCINTRLVWVIAIINLILNTILLISLPLKWDVPVTFTTAVVVSYSLNWVIVLGDVIANKVYNSYFWISSMIFFPSIASLFYLARKERLLDKDKAK